MTAWWVQVNVLYAREMSWPLNSLPRSSNGWYQALWPLSVNSERTVKRICEDDWVQPRYCLCSRSRAQKWREGKAPHTFEHSDRRWIRHNGNRGVELMLSGTDSPKAKTRFLVVGMKNNHTEVNEKHGEVYRDNPRGQILEMEPFSTHSCMMFIKLSRICPKHATRLRLHRCVEQVEDH